ncbi:MAG: FkbM family methyltransferase [Pseudomonadota bacterium]
MEQRRVRSFTEVLTPDCKIAIDGGAGYGSTAKEMLGAGVAHVHAFEPFEGNHKFFDDDDRITLHKTALGAHNGRGSFKVPETVKEGTLGWEDKVGYSSAGALESDTIKTWNPFDKRRSHVDVVRADDVVDHADFIKLDLQGGEPDALAGMPRLLSTASVLWVELIANVDIVATMTDAGFQTFSTPLLLQADHSVDGVEVFDEIPSSMGIPYLVAWKSEPWGDFATEFTTMKKRGLIQTDILGLRG